MIALVFDFENAARVLFPHKTVLSKNATTKDRTPLHIMRIFIVAKPTKSVYNIDRDATFISLTTYHIYQYLYSAVNE